MTPTEKKEIVRQEIIKAVPGILDLAFGCKVMFNDHERIVITNERGYVTFDIGRPMENLKVERLYKVIGRPITLFDTSKVVKDKHTLIDIWTEGSLDDQNDENIEWIHFNMVD